MQEKHGAKDLKEINFNHWGRSFLADFQPLGTLLKKINFSINPLAGFAKREKLP